MRISNASAMFNFQITPMNTHVCAFVFMCSWQLVAIDGKFVPFTCVLGAANAKRKFDLSFRFRQRKRKLFACRTDQKGLPCVWICALAIQL